MSNLARGNGSEGVPHNGSFLDQLFSLQDDPSSISFSSKRQMIDSVLAVYQGILSYGQRPRRNRGQEVKHQNPLQKLLFGTKEPTKDDVDFRDAKSDFDVAWELAFKLVRNPYIHPALRHALSELTSTWSGQDDRENELKVHAWRIAKAKVLQAVRFVEKEELLPLSRFLESPLPKTVRVNGRTYPNLLATIYSDASDRAKADAVYDAFLTDDEDIMMYALEYLNEVSLGDLVKAAMIVEAFHSNRPGVYNLGRRAFLGFTSDERVDPRLRKLLIAYDATVKGYGEGTLPGYREARAAFEAYCDQAKRR